MQSVRRQIKNVAYNFSDAQKKVREATSNSPWGPSTTQMMEIADYMKNPIAFNEIMSILWKRLNDSGKNWRHVFKSLVIIDFLIKCGNQKVVNLCKDNLFAITTLQDFQHVEEGRDQGMSVREKSKLIVRMVNGEIPVPTGPMPVPGSEAALAHDRRIDLAVEAVEIPSSRGEEELQLQMALQLSMQEQERSKNYDNEYEQRLQQALEASMRETEQAKASLSHKTALSFSPAPPMTPFAPSGSAVDDLLSLGDLNLPAPKPEAQLAWHNSGLQDPWANTTQQQLVQNNGFHLGTRATGDPWSPTSTQHTSQMTYDIPPPASQAPSIAPSMLFTPGGQYKLTSDGYQYVQAPDYGQIDNTANNNFLNGGAAAAPNAQSFLGFNSNNVDLEDLVGLNNLSTTNPFMTAQAPKKTPTINEMRTTQNQQAFPTPPLSPFQNTQLNQFSAFPAPASQNMPMNEFSAYPVPASNAPMNQFSAYPAPSSNTNPFASQW